MVFLNFKLLIIIIVVNIQMAYLLKRREEKRREEKRREEKRREEKRREK